MFNMSVKKGKPSPKMKVKLNEPYSAKCVSVEPAPGYMPGKAILIKYQLTDTAGNTLPHKETFHCSDDVYNERTEKFVDYLNDNGISNVHDLIGCTEEFIFLKDVTKRGTAIVIAQRKLISKGDADVGIQRE